jgi:hypothetical protein
MQSLLLFLHLFLVNISKAMTSSALLVARTDSLLSSRYNKDQNRSQ